MKENFSVGSNETQSAITRGELHAAQLLVVDDDEVIAQAVTKMLLSAGATVYTSNSPFEALTLLETRSVDAVITDLKMSEMDGFELMESVKQRDNTVSVVIMSSHASPDTATQATDLGASSYLRKPFKSDACVSAAAKALKERHMKIGIDKPAQYSDILVE